MTVRYRQKPTLIAVLSCALLCSALSCSQAAPAKSQQFFAVYMQGRKTGHAIRTREVKNHKVESTEEVAITINRGAVSVSIHSRQICWESTDGKPLAFRSTQQMSLVEMKVEGRIDEKRTIHLTTSNMGAEKKSTRPWPTGALMSEGMRLLSLKKGLKRNTKYEARVFVPDFMDAIDATLRVGSRQNVDLLGRVVQLTRIDTTMSMPGQGKIHSASFVDDDCRVHKDISQIAGMEIEMISCAESFARSENEALEIVRSMFVKSPSSIKDINNIKSLTYHLSPTSANADLSLPTDDNQSVKRLKNGEIVVTVTPIRAQPGSSIPYNGKDPVLLQAMKPARFIDSADPTVTALARRAIGTTTDASVAAAKIESFVASYISDKNFSVGHASASEVAVTKQGDCSEHAVLTAAMCRAVGIPAQVVSGIAYVDDFLGMRGFGGHAWTRAHINGKWIGLDAAFRGSGLGRYDAGHIALSFGDGDYDDLFGLATTLGCFKITSIEIDR
jgi:hypothetical protein